MTPAGFAGILDAAAGGAVLAAVLVVWCRDLRIIVWLLTAQGCALATIPFVEGLHDADCVLLGVGVVVLGLRAVLLPWLLARAYGAEPHASREVRPLVDTATSLLIAAGLTVAAFGIAQPLVRLDPGPAGAALPAAFAVISIALFVMATRRHAISQAAGFLMVDNGVAAVAFLLTAGVPLIVELGVSLDVLFAVLVIGVLTGRLRRTFGGADLDRLQELHE